MKNADGSHAVMQRSKTQKGVWVECGVLLVGEAIDDHNARVVWIGEACRVDDAVRSRWDANVVSSVTKTRMHGDEPWKR
jgi:hypothetical protein